MVRRQEKADQGRGATSISSGWKVPWGNDDPSGDLSDDHSGGMRAKGCLDGVKREWSGKWSSGL